MPLSFLLNKYSISLSYCRERCHFLSYWISAVYHYHIAEKSATLFLSEFHTHKKTNKTELDKDQISNLEKYLYAHREPGSMSGKIYLTSLARPAGEVLATEISFQGLENHLTWNWKRNSYRCVFFQILPAFRSQQDLFRSE